MYIKINEIKPSFLSRKRAITPFLSRKFMITRSSIAFEDFLGSSIAPQVMPPWLHPHVCKSACLQLVLLLKGFPILIPSLDPPSVRVCCLSTHPQAPNSWTPTLYVSLQHCEEVHPQLSGTPTHASDPSYASHCPPSPLIRLVIPP